MGLGDGVKITEPEALVEKMRQEIKRLQTQYDMIDKS
jgi:hypothetical protein